MDYGDNQKPGSRNQYVGEPRPDFWHPLFRENEFVHFRGDLVVCALATADAVSRERREGTLVLLYLTELRSLGIVVGKAFVHMLRAVSLFLTMAPRLMLPVVFGG